MEEYRLIRSARRTLSLSLDRDGTIIVRAPRTLPQGRIDAFLAEHAAWIAQHRKRLAERRAAHPELTPQQKEALRRRAKAYLPGRVAYYSRIMGLVPTGVRITSAETRFGSCSGKNSLCFSLHLMEYPPEAIDYVVVHELAHIRHKNHGSQFYALVASVLPDYRRRIAMLKT